MSERIENEAAEKARIAAEAEEIQRFIDAKPKVGFGRPPINHQFKKGISGNPRGRPPKPERAYSLRQIDADIIQAGETKVEIRINGKTEKLPAFEVGLLKMNMMGAQGDLKAIELGFKLRRDALKRHAAMNKKLHDVLEDQEQEALAKGHLPPNHEVFKQLRRWRKRSRRL